MAGRTVGGALIDILARMTLDEAKRFTLPSFREEIQKAGATSPWAKIADIVVEEVDQLTLSQFLLVIGCIRDFLKQESERRPSAEAKLIKKFATPHNVVRTLTAREVLAQMARIKAVPMPSEPPSQLDQIGQLVRTGHAEATPHWELAVSSQLRGAKMASYFYLSGSPLPSDRKAILPLLVAHDSDEVVIYLGYADRSRNAGSGALPIYFDARSDPYEHVEKPIKVLHGQFLVYDGANPHYWFAPENTVALFVSASPNQTFRKPVAFRSENRDSVTGGSYLLFETRRRRKPKRTADVQTLPVAPPKIGDERATYLFGKRLRRKRDGFGVSAKDIEKLKTRGRSINATVIGKIENHAISNIRVQLVAEYAEALDIPLTELLPREPSQSEGADLREMRKPPTERERHESTSPEQPYAIVPQLVHPVAPTDDAIDFFEGEADVVLLPLEGAVDVYVVPDPLLLALELVHDSMERPDQPGFELGAGRLRIFPPTIERLKRRQLLYQESVCERQAMQFNAVLPHAVVPATGTSPEVVVVTTRNDIHLPERWTTPRSGSAER